MSMVKCRAPRNRTLQLTADESDELLKHTVFPAGSRLTLPEVENRIICGDIFASIPSIVFVSNIVAKIGITILKPIKK